MFNETCALDEFPVDVGADAPVCMSESLFAAFLQSGGHGNVVNKAVNPGPVSGGSLGTVNVSAGGLDWTTIAIYGGIGLLVLAIFTGGRRR